ncbi:integral membrane protein [Colletotrichum asianum]|uniref:Integral membrane protein n=1 Tax=Colletotrichum asianum TaxID=702518 RepID=A0A8H3W427_9PEZI|nr:integral membrane protein [Colletotrichum asianum]
MEYFKKAKSQVKGAVKEAQVLAQQLQSQHQYSQPQYQQQQPQQNSYSTTTAQYPNHKQQLPSSYSNGHYGNPGNGVSQVGSPQYHYGGPQHSYHHGQPINGAQAAMSPGYYPQQMGAPQPNVTYQAPPPPPTARPQPQLDHGYHGHQGYHAARPAPPPPPLQYNGHAVTQQPGHGQTQNPSGQTFDMTAMSQALDPGPNQSRDATQAQPQNQQRQAHHQQDLPSPVAPLPNAAALAPCPKYDMASLEVVSFYVLKDEVLNAHQTSPGRKRTDSDAFAICSACFASAVASTGNAQLSACFHQRVKAIPKDPETPRQTFEQLKCRYATVPRLRAVISQFGGQQKPPHQSSAMIGSLVHLAKSICELGPCAGAGPVTEETPYYTSRALDQLAVCSTCFEQFLRGTPFEREMYRSAPMSGWGCDVRGIRGLVFKMLARELDAGPQRMSFGRFAEATRSRLAIGCAGENNPIWPAESSAPHYSYEPHDPSKAGVFCEACYWDFVHGTAVDRFFNNRVRLDEEFRGTISCDLGGVASRFAMQCAVRCGDDEVWRRCISRRGTLPPCVGLRGVDEEDLLGKNGDDDSVWYCLAEHASIEVCPFCYNSTVELLGASHHFTPITRPLSPGVVRFCFLSNPADHDADTSDSANFENTLVWRGLILRRWLHQGFDSHRIDDFAGFRSAAGLVASWPPPCGGSERAFKSGSGRKWFGNAFYLIGDDEHHISLNMCEECHDDVVKGTSLEYDLSHDKTARAYEIFPDGLTCNIGTSRRLRDELAASLKKGTFVDFAQYFYRRKDVSERKRAIDKLCQEQTVRQQQMLDAVNLQGQAAALNLMQQLNANTNAVIMGVGGSVSAAAATDYGQRFGNATVGYGHLTHGSAAAAQAHHDAQNMAARQRQGVSAADFQPCGDTWADTQQLLALAKAVEEEWKAVN